MKGDNSRKVGDIIRKLMKNPKLETKLDNLDAIAAWEEIIGLPLCKYITRQRVCKGVLYAKIKSSVARNELSYKKSELITQINNKIGKKLITDIVLQ